ncbi:CapA family protein [Phosphitispora sp. TUW77]|uniref:CapA family protein n=1 Tax=Phosphitispora sp. TUW77 TaxID=3152361 RepID=UPI003AB2E091
MDLIIGGDLVPTKSNLDLFNNGDVRELLGEELLIIWNCADVRIFNLEVPLCDKADPIQKCGPNLIAPTSTVSGIKALNPSLITLANNHILDQGVQGLKSTEMVLTENQIPFIGIGDKLSDASKPYIINKDGYKIGVYACAEHEFSIANENIPGANPFDPLESLDHILNLKAECDYVIVLYHGGKEHYRYPSPHLLKACRKMADKGADIVVCQHSHCIGAYEEYKGKTIVYGQGNFIFDGLGSDFWQTSLLIKVNISHGLYLEYVPIVREGNKIRLAEKPEAENILQLFQQRSSEILAAGFVDRKYKQFASENHLQYLRSFAGFGKWLLRLDRRLLNGWLIRKKYNKKQLLAMQNYVECESHRELLLAGFSARETSQEHD